MRPWAVIFMLTTLLASAPAAARSVGELSAFKDWSAVCDNLRTCTAFGWHTGDLAFTAWLKLSRGGAGRDLPTIRIAMMPEDGAAPASAYWRLAVDGKVIPGLPPLKVTEDQDYRRVDLAGDQAMTLVAAMRSGSTLTAIEGAKPVMAISLNGATAALLWLDDRQQRLGATTALVRKGPKPAEAVPAPPPAPLIVAAPAVSQAGLPKKVPAAITGLMGDDCDVDTAVASFPPIIARLAQGKVLWGPVCSTGAYNVLHVFFIADEQGRGARKVIFPEPPGAKPAGYEELMNVDYDPKTRILTSFSKGRGMGDCGSDSAWVWDGKAFRLLSERVMPECLGVSPDNWPSIWRARVK